MAKFSLLQLDKASTLEPFEFEGPNGEQCQLPHIRKLPVRLGMAVLGSDLEAIEKVLTAVGAKLPFDLLDLDSELLEALMNEWKEHSGVAEEDAQGESAASPRSSKSTARSSRSTSGATSKRPTRKR